ncbi:MAG: DUF2834 domain-containing protein [Bacteroidota bacterium]
MKLTYLILAIIGFIGPNFFVAQVSVETGNVLLWLNPAATMAAMFANKIATAFVVDLLLVVIVFFVWSWHEAKKYNVKNLWLVWLLTMMFGLAFTFPLFLYFREKNFTTA